MSVSADDHRANRLWKEALAEWKANCIEVENVFYCHLNKCWCLKADGPEYRHEITDGQPCELEGSKVTKLLT